MFSKIIVLFLILNILVACSSKKSVDSGGGEEVVVVQLIDLTVAANTPVSVAYHGELYDFSPVVEDMNAVHFTIENMPSWLEFDLSTGRLWGTPSQEDVGVYSGIAITVFDDKGNAQSFPPFTLTIVNTAPIISGAPNPSVNQNEQYQFSPQASDIDGDELTYSMTGSPGWLAIDESTGVVSGLPSQADVGVTTGIVITVSDSSNASASLDAFTLTVIDVNDAPVISGSPITSVDQNAQYLFTPQASDLDNDVLTYTVTGNPSWLSIDSGTGVLSGTPSQADVGVASGIVVTVSDPSGASASLDAFTLTVVNINDVPTISGSPSLSVLQGKAYSFTPVVIDIDNDELVFNIVNKPSWASFDTANGKLSGTPQEGSVGTTEGIVILVSDGNSEAQLAAFNLEVIEVSVAELTGKINGVGFGDNDLGFDFTKLGADGEILDSTADSWSCIKDNRTGMIWEAKTGQGLHNKNDRYMWNFDNDNTGFARPSLGALYSDDDVCFGDVDCNTKSFVDRVNATNLCGASDWRIPNREELRSLSKLNDMTEADDIVHIDTDYFPNTMPSHKVDCMDFYDRDIDNILTLKVGVENNPDYLSSCVDFGVNGSGNRPYQNLYRGRGIGYATVDTDYSLSPTNSWVIYYDDNEMDHSLAKDELRYVRLVRGDSLNKDYSISTDGLIVTDNHSGLDWKRCAEGYSWAAGACTAVDPAAIDFTYTEAELLADDVNGWRLPTVKELSSLTDLSLKNPASAPTISTVFSDTPTVSFWTSTSHQLLPIDEERVYKWLISFANGGDKVQKVLSSARAHVRLVRDAPSGS